MRLEDDVAVKDDVGRRAVFDGPALIAALDRKRAAEGQRWQQLAVTLWDQSSELNDVLGDAPLCPGALQRTARRGTMSCQYALSLLRWIDMRPEDFLVGAVVEVDAARLPDASPSQRLRWVLPDVYAALDAERRSRGLTWVALGEQLGCTPSRLTNLKTARLADMGLVMSVLQWIPAPSHRFIVAADW
jgi:hypothetical protein